MHEVVSRLLIFVSSITKIIVRKMKKLIFLKMLCLLTVTMFGQDEPIKGMYGSNDVRIRAGNGWIEEGRLNKFDFQKSGLKNIAVLYQMRRKNCSWKS